MADQSRGIGLFNYAVTHVDGDRFTAIKAWAFDAHLPSRK
jgi:hypothetical protein